MFLQYTFLQYLHSGVTFVFMPEPNENENLTASILYISDLTSPLIWSINGLNVKEN